MVTLNPQAMWKKSSNQSWMGKVISQVLMIGGGSLDRFLRQFLF